MTENLNKWKPLKTLILKCSTTIFFEVFGHQHLRLLCIRKVVNDYFKKMYKHRIKVNRNKYVPMIIYVLLYLLYHLSSLSTFSLPWSYLDFIEKFFEKNENFFFGIRELPQNVKDISEAIHTSFNDINQTIIVQKKFYT